MGLFKKSNQNTGSEETESKETTEKSAFFSFGRKKTTAASEDESIQPDSLNSSSTLSDQSLQEKNTAQTDNSQVDEEPKATGRFSSLKNKVTPTVEEALSYVPAKKQPTLLPGSEGEHELQEKFTTKQRAMNFYGKQVLSFLAPEMQKFIEKQEFLFISTSDAKGECDCTSKLGEAGFIRVLNEKYLVYPEYRGNGVYANLGNISENPHIGLLIIDFYKDTIGLHVNGKARILENEDLLQFKDNIPTSVIAEISKTGNKKPERWVMVEVEEAYVQCSKHIPLLKKLDKRLDWGTDSEVEKKVDYFQLHDIPLYDRLGGDKTMEIVVDHFYRKVLKDDFVAHFFEDVDMDAQREKQKGFLAYAFGGPYRYSGNDLRSAHERLVNQMGLNEKHFDHLLGILKETFLELHVHEKEINQILSLLESTRSDVLCR
jgi:truncated hemoglobin YjbI/predicted pyridoxine 5'-phosphate oxidase superfamily flavin-nucleotide-binding protein